MNDNQEIREIYELIYEFMQAVNTRFLAIEKAITQLPATGSESKSQPPGNQASSS